MNVALFGVACWLVFFAAFLWAAFRPHRMVDLRRAFLLDETRISRDEIWIVRGSGALCIVCATWAALVSGHASFAWCIIPGALLVYVFIELVHRKVFERVAGKYWPVRLAAVVPWCMAAALWSWGNAPFVLGLLVIGCVYALWPGGVARFMADYASRETQVKWT